MSDDTAPRPTSINVPFPHSQSTSTCHCCARREVRVIKHVGQGSDGGYQVAVCPNCDTGGGLS